MCYYCTKTCQPIKYEKENKLSSLDIEKSQKRRQKIRLQNVDIMQA